MDPYATRRKIPIHPWTIRENGIMDGARPRHALARSRKRRRRVFDRTHERNDVWRETGVVLTTRPHCSDDAICSSRHGTSIRFLPRTLSTTAIRTRSNPAIGSRRSPVAAARTSIPQTAVTRSSAGVGVWLPSYIERLALAPLESVAETMRARVGVRRRCGGHSRTSWAGNQQ